MGKRTFTARRLLAFLLFLIAGLFISMPAAAQSRTEYRAFWVDTFNTSLNNHANVVTVVNNAKAAKANALFAQVRRRGDSWYLISQEPAPDPSFIQAGFDPLADLILTAHAEGIEVHAFVIVGAVWNKNPTVAGGRHVSPSHVFNRHGGYDPNTQQIVPGPNNWLTRTLLPDNVANGITFQGHRFGSDFWIDLGHPDAAADTVDVLMNLVNNYDIDGLHLDRIRYPEFTAAGQTPTNGTNIGYNPTSVDRFNQRHSRSGNPLAGDPLWSQWRRDQVSNVVRRVYLNAIAVKPQLKVSAALIAFGGGPSTEAAWNSAEAYWRVYQDWRSWTQEGILDLAIPMNYKRADTNGALYNTWNEWIKNHQYNRAAVIGQGAFLNSIEGTLLQTRRALEPSATGDSAKGIMYFSMATSNIAVAANPLSIPAGQNTPLRPFAEFASGLTTGKSVNGLTLYEPTGLAPIFADTAAIPTFSWKTAPTVGHIKGFAKRTDETPLDTAVVTIKNTTTNAERTGATDGGGFYGGVDLQPGQYLVKAVLGNETLYSCVTNVIEGAVAEANISAENTIPETTALLVPATPNGSNGWYTTNVDLNLSAVQGCSGVEPVQRTEYSTDGGVTWLPYSGTVTISQEGMTTVIYRSIGTSGSTEAAKSISLMIDKTAPTVQLTATPSVIWPPNGKSVNVSISGIGTDAVSGLAGVSYVVTDEYGTELSIASRALSGNSANWMESLSVEARRNGDDRDGRLYRVTATVTDQAGLTSSGSVDIVVAHDKRR